MKKLKITLPFFLAIGFISTAYAYEMTCEPGSPGPPVPGCMCGSDGRIHCSYQPAG